MARLAALIICACLLSVTSQAMPQLNSLCVDEELEVVMLQVDSSIQNLVRPVASSALVAPAALVDSNSSSSSQVSSGSSNSTSGQSVAQWKVYLDQMVKAAIGKTMTVPVWTVVTLVFLMGSSSIYAICYIIWSKSKRQKRMANLKAAKEHSREGSVLSQLVQMAIDHLDSELIGVNVDFESLEIKPLEGILEIRGMVVENPETYWCDHFIRAELIHVDIDMEALILSGGKRIVIQELIASDVDVIWERALFTSNLMEIVNKLKMNSDASTAQVKKTPDKGETKVEVGKVELSEISFKIASYRLAGSGIRAMVSDISFENYSEEMGDSLTAASQLLPLLIQSILVTLLANIIGRTATEAMFQGFSFVARDIFGSLYHLLGGAFAALCCCRREKKLPKPATNGGQKVSKTSAAQESVSCSSCMAPCSKLLESVRGRREALR